MARMAHGPAWLDAMVGTIRCASCGAMYARADLRIAGEREGYVFVHCACGACRKEGIAVVLTELATAPKTRSPFTKDDVLAAHDILREHTGGIDALFSAEGRRL